MAKTSETPSDADIGGADSLRISRPPSGFTVLSGWEVTTAGQLHGLRAAIRDEVVDCRRTGRDGGLDVVAPELVLIASELVTNAIRHGRPPVIVRLLKAGSRFLLTVV